MKEALKEANKAYLKKEVPVGAVIVKDGKIIARAHNLRETRQNAIAHAEILCIEKACKKINNWRLDDCIMYVSLYPCQMCIGAIKQSRISKVYYGAKDDKILMYDDKLCEYVESYECSNILKNFFKELREK
jgi:tRNA(adenine34) deaminase